MTNRIEIIQGDITQMRVDVIVNAANNSLLGGGGVDGAIHRAAGPGLLEVCQLLNGCETGKAKITPGFKLPARFVIHTVGPVWKDGNGHERELLASCYTESLKLATVHNLHTIAFPNISTGVYHFPKEEAAQIALREVKNYLEQFPIPHIVSFVCFDQENYQIYRDLLR